MPQGCTGPGWPQYTWHISYNIKYSIKYWHQSVPVPVPVPIPLQHYLPLPLPGQASISAHTFILLCTFTYLSSSSSLPTPCSFLHSLTALPRCPTARPTPPPASLHRPPIERILSLLSTADSTALSRRFSSTDPGGPENILGREKDQQDQWVAGSTSGAGCPVFCTGSPAGSLTLPGSGLGCAGRKTWGRENVRSWGGEGRDYAWWWKLTHDSISPNICP